MEARTIKGLDALEAISDLLQRRRAAHPTWGTFEAADMQWSWRKPRQSDDLEQLFWLDAEEKPVAAAYATSGEDWTLLHLVTLPAADEAWVRHVVERGIAHADSLNLPGVEIVAPPEDVVLIAALEAQGFRVAEDENIDGWIEADAIPRVSPLADGYCLTDRAAEPGLPHPMIERNGEQVEERLRETSLYRPDLDLTVLDADGNGAAYGIFWFHPAPRIGMVEPMRTEDAHQRQGLARHVLTAGLHRLRDLGAERMLIGWEPENPGSGPLYRDVGFVPLRRCVLLTRPEGK